MGIRRGERRKDLWIWDAREEELDSIRWFAPPWDGRQGADVSNLP